MGEKAFTALSTSKFMRVSNDELPIGAGSGETGFGTWRAFGAASLVAALLRSSSRSLHRVVRISTVSSRSFFSVAILVNSARQASRSTLRFSFSNSSGVSASVLVLHFFNLSFGFTGGGAGALDTAAVDEKDVVGREGGGWSDVTEEQLDKGDRSGCWLCGTGGGCTL